MNGRWPQGAGLGFRRELLRELEAGVPEAVDFFELAPENWAGMGGRSARQLRTFYKTCLVCFFYPQYKITTLLFCKQIIVQCCAYSAKMQASGWARCKSYSYFTHEAKIN